MGQPPVSVCMVAYCASPTLLPPMLHEGIALAADGHTVLALCPGADDGVERHAPGFRTTRFAARAGRGDGARAGGVRGAVGRLLAYGAFVARAAVRAFRSDARVYEAHDLPPLLPALLAAKLRGRPLVYHAHELYAESRPDMPFAWFWRRMDRLLVPHCDLVVTPEEHRSAIYREEYAAREVLTVRNCPPHRPPLRSSLLRDVLRLRGVDATTIVLYQGLLDDMRCIAELAEASRRFDEGVVLVIVGAGEGRWRDPAVLAGYERVVVLPRVPYEELARYTASADVGVLLYRDDCRNNRYCAPNKVFEYMAMGLPVLASDLPGIRGLVVGDGVGLCVDPERPAEIAAAVNTLARDADLRARMRARGLRLAAERDRWDLESRPLIARFRALSAPRSAGRPAPQPRG